MSDLTARRRLANLAGQHFGGDRDLYKVMGYPKIVSAEEYVDSYLRQDLAGRIVDAYPDATWREPPEVKGDETLIQSFDDVQRRTALWRTMHRLDRLMNMGHYGVLLMGLDGGENMALPANGSDYNLLYLQPHSERTAEITQWEDDPNSPRYGKPKLYRITTGVNWTGAGAGRKSLNVHHSRVIHVAERALEDASIGTPRLERIWNRLMDLDKTLGGSAEIYWQNVAMLMAFKAEADTEFSPEDKQEMADQIEEMQNGLRRAIRLRGIEVQNLAPGMMGNGSQGIIDDLLKIIGGSSGIPQRILIGNEQGQLASSQDENSWAARIAERREQLATPSFVEAFISAGISLGFLQGNYEETVWPEADTLGEQGRADIADKKASALQKYMMTPGADLVVTGEEFRNWLGEEEAMPDITEDEVDEAQSEVITQFERRKNG